MQTYTIFHAFFTKKSACLRQTTGREFKGKGHISAEIQEKLLFLEPGEELYARYDSEKDRYCASDYNGPLGYFPASVSSLLEDDPRIFVSEVKQSPTTDKYSVSAAILLEE